MASPALPALHAADGMLAVLALAAWAVALTLTDVRTLRIPPRLRLLGLFCALLALAAFARGEWSADSRMLAHVAAGAALLAAFYLAARVANPAALGGGDLRLAPTIGALGGIAGPGGIALVLVAPFAVSGAWGLYERLARSPGAGGRAFVPHGPGMAWSAVAALLLAV